MTSVVNSAPDRLLISTLFSSSSGVLFCSFIWTMILCSFWQPPGVSFYVLGRAALTSCLSNVAYYRKVHQ